jgi:hypothetical protein
MSYRSAESWGPGMDRYAWIDEQLAAVPLFVGLSKKQLRRISSLTTRIDRPAGQVLTTEGQRGYSCVPRWLRVHDRCALAY